jgi:hypothetical protein
MTDLFISLNLILIIIASLGTLRSKKTWQSVLYLIIVFFSCVFFNIYLGPDFIDLVKDIRITFNTTTLFYLFTFLYIFYMFLFLLTVELVVDCIYNKNKKNVILLFLYLILLFFVSSILAIYDNIDFIFLIIVQLILVLACYI